jgi:hypothetical protein
MLPQILAALSSSFIDSTIWKNDLITAHPNIIITNTFILLFDYISETFEIKPLGSTGLIFIHIVNEPEC